jgi:anti-sigma-K factor RskA
MTEDDDILAAEYALGLLSTDEALAVEARLKMDGPLSLRVAWWRDQLSPLAVEAEVEPDARVWSGIEARLGVNDNAPDRARPWKWATGGMGAVAAALLAVIALRPPPVPLPVPVETATPAAPLVASLSGERGMAVTIAYDSSSKRILVTPVTLDPGKGDAELWVIPAGQAVPVSLGVIDAKLAASHNLDAPHAALLAPGATFAISQEARGGSPTGAPQGAVVASGKIIRV